MQISLVEDEKDCKSRAEVPLATSNNVLNGREDDSVVSTIANSSTSHPLDSYQKILKSSFATGITFFSFLSIESVGGFTCAYFMKEIDLVNFEAAVIISAIKGGVILLFASPGYAVGSFIGEYHKANKPQDELVRMQQAGLIVNVFEVIPVISLFACANQWLNLLGQPAEVTNIVQTFFWAYLPGTVAVFLGNSVLVFITALNKRSSVIILDLAILGISISLSNIFILGKLGLPQLGAQGYGYAQMITACCQAILLYSLVFGKRDFRTYKLYKPRWHYKEDIIKILKAGLPTSIGILGEVGILFALPLLAGSLGTEQLAVQGIISFYTSLMLIFSVSFFRGSTTLISQLKGKGALENVPRYVGINAILAASIPLVGLLLTATIPEQIANTFISNIPIHSNIGMPDDLQAERLAVFQQNVYSQLRTAFPVAALTATFDSTRCVLLGTLIGLNKVKVAGPLNLLVQLLGILPVIYAVGLHTSSGVTGMHAVYCVGVFFLMLTMVYFVKRSLAELKGVQTTVNSNLTQRANIQSSTTSASASGNPSVEDGELEMSMIEIGLDSQALPPVREDSMLKSSTTPIVASEAQKMPAAEPPIANIISEMPVISANTTRGSLISNSWMSWFRNKISNPKAIFLPHALSSATESSFAQQVENRAHLGRR